jgi:cytidylate kinase
VDAARPDAGRVPAHRLVVAVDGPSGAGKSSVSRAVARRLGLRYLDTGAMYRAMTWWMLRHEVDVGDADAVAAAAGKPEIRPGTDPYLPAITLDGEDVSGAIRTRRVTSAVSAVSAVPAVRARMVALQREVIGDGGIVVEGRDIGTAVAPEAPVKVYLTAAAAARAERRTAEFSHDPQVSVGITHGEMARRDRLDSTRAASPLVRAADAVEIDTTALTLEEVVERVLDLVRERTGPPA